MNVWKTIYRISWVVLTVLILAGVGFIFGPKFKQYSELHAVRNKIKSENQHLEAEIAVLRNKLERFASDPRFVERTAKEMGMARVDEIVFKFEEESRSSQ